VFVAAPFGGLLILDITDPITPLLRKQIDIPGAYDVAVSDPYAYVCTEEDGLYVVDISTLNLAYVVNPPNSYHGNQIAIDGDTAWVASGGIDGLRAIDISNPLDPQQLGSIFGLYIEQFKIQDNYAYIAAGDESNYPGLNIYDISDPASPQFLSNFWAYQTRGADMQDNYAYISGNGGIVTVDITDPYNPIKLGQHDGYSSFNVLVDGNFLYGASSYLSVVDVSNLYLPVDFSNVTGGYLINDMAKRENYIYAAAGHGGLAIIKLWDK
jgi:hypothetical protein